MNFEVKYRAAAGRIGQFETKHGSVTTPTLLPVVNPNLPTVPPADMKRLFGAQMVITNSYILRKRDDLRQRVLRDGVHKTIGWDGPVMTDSGTFQSYIYGKVDVQPHEIIEFQKQIGVDVGTILDVFTTPDKTEQEASLELDETLKRAAQAVAAKDGMMLAATVQGGAFPALRKRAAQGIAALDVDLIPIGGVVPLMEQGRYADLTRAILAAKPHLPSGKPVHLFGAGHPLVFPLAAALGCDVFDSASYAKYAKDGRMIFADGTRILADLDELACPCAECAKWKDPAELLKAPPAEREASLARHNLYVSFAEIRRIHQAIRDGALWELVEQRAAGNPALQDALRVLRGEEPTQWLLQHEPLSGTRAFVHTSAHTLHRPLVRRLHDRLLARWTPRHKVCYVLGEREKPYTDAYATYLDAFTSAQADFVVDTPFGPVPLELDRLWPVAQNVFPQHLDADARQVRDDYAARFFAKFDGCEVLPADLNEFAARAEGPTMEARDRFDRRRLESTADMQFGPGASQALFPHALEFRRSVSECTVRNVMSEGEHVVSLRARDGLLSLRVAGAQRLKKALEGDRMRIRLENEPASFVRSGKNVMAKFVVAADPELRPRDDALVVDAQDEVVAVGRCNLSGWEMRQFQRGLAARNTERVAEE